MPHSTSTIYFTEIDLEDSKLLTVLWLTFLFSPSLSLGTRCFDDVVLLELEEVRSSNFPAASRVVFEAPLDRLTVFRRFLGVFL